MQGAVPCFVASRACQVVEIMHTLSKRRRETETLPLGDGGLLSPASYPGSKLQLQSIVVKYYDY